MKASKERTEEKAATRATVLAVRKASSLPVAFMAWAIDSQQHLRVTEWSGARRVPENRTPTIAKGAGLGGKVLMNARPAAVSDYLSSRSISHEYDFYVKAEGLRALVAVPVIVGSTVRGVLYGVTHEQVRLGNRVLSAVVEAGRQLEQSLAVQDQADVLISQARAVTAGRYPRSNVAWGELRAAHAELLNLADRVDDIHLKERLHTVCSKLASAHSPGQSSPGLPAVLTPREVDVLAGAAAGRTNPEIADQLGLSLETVKSYLRSVMRKLGTSTRLEAVAAARRAGLLP
ncbi:LuxR C-terminal-related transcriptional regulator [Streptomyces sp. NBC_00878]|uniref:LuxR C-terminal-related transcriptional regulator n=1 Tax=Streptomyces sp. NBC_00878 TaxID=2975854 RepID=UPI00225452A0|nr:LuxR C-terminal-related transcriptional regulator [Streptomyces sp. NBC_00878]MCX4903176.1 LuxR C-terminal-related transcriptional regulator [Streptomyces sp. NBC_00878]